MDFETIEGYAGRKIADAIQGGRHIQQLARQKNPVKPETLDDILRTSIILGVETVNPATSGIIIYVLTPMHDVIALSISAARLKIYGAFVDEED